MSQTRFSVKYLRILTLAALLAACAPVAFRAQEPVAKPEAVKTQEAAQPEAKKEEKSSEDQENVFRLEGPIVKWTSKTFNVAPETAARGFEILNFLILVFGIGIPLVRTMPRIFRKRSEIVRSGLDEARRASAAAAERMSAIESKLSGLDAEIAAIRQQVEQESAQDEVRIKAAIEDEKVRIVAGAEQEIAVAAAHARRSLQDYAAELAIEQAARQVVLTPETDKALIEEFLNSVGGTN